MGQYVTQKEQTINSHKIFDSALKKKPWEQSHSFNGLLAYILCLPNMSHDQLNQSIGYLNEAEEFVSVIKTIVTKKTEIFSVVHCPKSSSYAHLVV